MEAFVGLMGAYGFEKSFEDPAQHLMRFQGDDTFIDLWNGRRGVTAGVYNPHTKKMRYEYRLTLEQLEEVLIKLTK